LGGLHLAAVRAGAGILIDALATGSIIDDRPRKAASAADAIKRLTKPGLIMPSRYRVVATASNKNLRRFTVVRS
jgi:hypothetical protein